MCQKAKTVRHKPFGEMQALPLPSTPFEPISIDFITDRPPSMGVDSSKASDSILIIGDRYTKVVRYIACTKKVKVPELARLFMRYRVKGQGIPKVIILDRGL